MLCSHFRILHCNNWLVVCTFVVVVWNFFNVLCMCMTFELTGARTPAASVVHSISDYESRCHFFVELVFQVVIIICHWKGILQHGLCVDLRIHSHPAIFIGSPNCTFPVFVRGVPIPRSAPQTAFRMPPVLKEMITDVSY
jgi:hypothetical protein